MKQIKRIRRKLKPEKAWAFTTNKLVRRHVLMRDLGLTLEQIASMPRHEVEFHYAMLLAVQNDQKDDS